MFRRKYKINKRKKVISSYKLFFILCIALFLVSSGYAYMSSTLKITGTVTLEHLWPSRYGNSTYTYEEGPESPWPSSDNQMVYDAHLYITNLDETYTGNIEVSFDLTEGFVYDSNSDWNIWQAQSVSVVGNRVTIVYNSNASNLLAYGETTDIYLQIPYAHIHEGLEITNVTLNGLYVRCINDNPGNNPNTNTNVNNTATNTSTNTNTTTNNTNTSGGGNEPSIPEDGTFYNYTIDGSWGNNTSYNITLNIEYTGERLINGIITFEVPKGLQRSNVNFYQADVISVESLTEEKDIVTIQVKDYVVSELNNNGSYSLGAQLVFNNSVNFSLNHVTLNGTTLPYSP